MVISLLRRTLSLLEYFKLHYLAMQCLEMVSADISMVRTGIRKGREDGGISIFGIYDGGSHRLLGLEHLSPPPRVQ